PRTRSTSSSRPSAWLRLRVDGGSLRLGRRRAALLDRGTDPPDQARHGGDADLGAYARMRRHDGDDDRRSLGRAARPRARRVGATGGRGLVRAAVPAPARADARVRRARPHDAPARGASRLPGTPLPAAVLRRQRTREAAQAYRATAPAR